MKSTKKMLCLLMTAAVLSMTACNVSERENTAGGSVDEPVYSATQAAKVAQVKEENTHNDPSQFYEINEMKYTLDSENNADTKKFTYSGRDFNINIELVNNYKNAEKSAYSVDINGSVIDIKDEYLEACSPLRAYAVIYDINQDGMQDVLIELNGDKTMSMAAFIANGNGYTKVSEPADTADISIKVLDAGKMQVVCEKEAFKKEFDMTETLKQWLRTEGIYESNTLKNADAAALKTRDDKVGYKLDVDADAPILEIERSVAYNNAATGVVYTQRYKYNNGKFELLETKIDYSAQQFR